MSVGCVPVGSTGCFALSGHCIFLCPCMCNIKASNGLFPMVLLGSMISYIGS